MAVDANTGICDGSAVTSTNALAWIYNNEKRECDRESKPFSRPQGTVVDAYYGILLSQPFLPDARLAQTQASRLRLHLQTSSVQLACQVSFSATDAVALAVQEASLPDQAIARPAKVSVRMTPGICRVLGSYHFSNVI